MSYKFAQAAPRRENGASLLSAYTLSWQSIHWQPFLRDAPNLQKASSYKDGIAIDVAMTQPDAPGVYELAIAHKDVPHKRYVVYIGAAENIRDACVSLLHGNELKGFLDDCLKKNHLVWLRVKTMRSATEAVENREKTLSEYDYAWIQQPSQRARSLSLHPNYFLGCRCCCRTGLQVTEGASKLIQQKSGGLLQMLSGKKR